MLTRTKTHAQIPNYHPITNRSPPIPPQVLHALEAFGSAVDEHLHLMLPALVRLFRPGVAPVSVNPYQNPRPNTQLPPNY